MPPYRGPEVFTVHTDVKMTRRKRLCHITNDEGTPIWSGGKVFSAFEQMLELGQYHFHIEHEGVRLRVLLATVRE